MNSLFALISHYLAISKKSYEAGFEGVATSKHNKAAEDVKVRMSPRSFLTCAKQPITA